jgi:hypothetical protein
MKKKQKHLYRLLSAQHDGRLLSDDEQLELAALLDDDEGAQFDYFQIERMFHDLESNYIGNCAETVVREFPVQKNKVVPLFGWAMAVAASLVVAFLLVPRPGSERNGLLVDTESTMLMNDECSFVARVVDSSSVEWGKESTVEILNGELKAGVLDLQKGSLDVVFDNGVRFGFVAPVLMDLSSMQRLSLRSGNLVLDVPGLADGLTINTPDGVLKAHTARARIQCGEEEEATLVNMVSGAINLYTEDESGREVFKHIVRDESVELVRGTDEPVKKTRRVIEPRIDLSQPPELENLQYVHYRFDESRGNRVKNHGTIPGADGWLEGISVHSEYPAPRRVNGRFNRALEFSGHGEGMLADLKNFDSDEPGSVAFWIKMDPDTVPGKYENIFSWHMYTWPAKEAHLDDEQQLACRIRINESASEGVVGAVRIEFRDRWICGTTDLRDGRWHHVTAVFHRGQYGTMVRHYVDGNLARSSAQGKTWFPQERYPEIGGGSIAVGRVYWKERPEELAPTAPFGLRGMVDELYVFNQAVLPSHASRLHMKNMPNQVHDVAFVPWGQRSVGMLSLPFKSRAD